MSIRLKLSLSVALLFTVCLTGLGLMLMRIETAHLRADAGGRRRLIESTVRRAGQDALLQQDDLLLLSYVKFLQKQFPEFASCKITWRDGERVRRHTIGTLVSSGKVSSKVIRVLDPADENRELTLDVGVDEKSMQALLDEQIALLQRNLLRLFGIALIVAIIFADWFARKITRPVAELSRAATQIGEGKLGVRLDWKSNDELGLLVQGFNRMSQRLEELDAMKKDFVSAVTHELRSPLGAIDSFLSLMESKMEHGRVRDPSAFATYFDRVKQNVRRLSGFITDLLDVAKIERGKMECVLKPIRLRPLAEDVVQFFEAKAQQTGVRILNKLDTGGAKVDGDAERLRQVFVNLISNALKFTPRGGKIWITSEQFRENGSKYLEVAIQDSGRGIGEEDLQKLFQKFQQGQNTKRRVSGSHGTGLGLFIVRSIVEAHGGKVSVKSEVGKGTKFLFSLRMV